MPAAISAGKPVVLVATADRLCEVIDGSGYDLDPAVKWGALTSAVDGDFHQT